MSGTLVLNAVIGLVVFVAVASLIFWAIRTHHKDVRVRTRRPFIGRRRKESRPRVADGVQRPVERVDSSHGNRA